MSQLPVNKRCRTSVIQIHCVPGDLAANLERIRVLVGAAAADGAHLAIVPETATTGYFIADQLDRLAESVDGPTSGALAQIAADCRIHLAVGMAIVENGRFFDAQLLYSPEGRLLATYKKVHLFSAEREWYASGDVPMVVDTAIGRIGMSICYDLMFPEFIRRLVDDGADIVINSTNWISDAFQREVWGWTGSTVESLARIRALENGTWVAMANCTGTEAGAVSLGHSCVVAPSGKVLASAGTCQGFASADIVYASEDLDRWRAVATYRPDRRPEVYR